MAYNRCMDGGRKAIARLRSSSRSSSVRSCCSWSSRWSPAWRLPRLGGAPACGTRRCWSIRRCCSPVMLMRHWLGRFGAAAAGGDPSRLVRARRAELPIGLMAATRRRPTPTLPLGAVAAAGLDRAVVPGRLRPGAAAPALVRADRRWRSLSALRRLELRQLRRPASLIPWWSSPCSMSATQRWLWSAGYGLLALLVAWCALQLPTVRPQPPAQADARRDRAGATIGMWIAARRRPVGPDPVDDAPHHHRHHRHAVAVGAPARPLSAELHRRFRHRRALANWVIVRLAPMMLLVAACGLHATSARGRESSSARAAHCSTCSRSRSRSTAGLFDAPSGPAQLTLFYLAMSIGGVLGGSFCALVAPMIFDWTYEHLAAARRGRLR